MTDELNINQQVPFNEEKILLGDTEYDMMWLRREMDMDVPGAKGPTTCQNLVMHFDVKGDLTFMDRLRLAWQKSELNTAYALERFPPEEAEEGGVAVPVFTAILVNIDGWAAEALKNQFVLGLQDTYPEQEAPSAGKQIQAEADEEFTEAVQKKIAEAEEAEEEEAPEPTFDLHGAGLQEIPDPEAEPKFDPHGAGLQEMPDDNEV